MTIKPMEDASSEIIMRQQAIIISKLQTKLDELRKVRVTLMQTSVRDLLDTDEPLNAGCLLLLNRLVTKITALLSGGSEKP